MKVAISVETYSIKIDLSPAFVKDIIPLLRSGGGNDAYTLQQRQTFNSLAHKMEEVMSVTDKIEAKRVLL